MSIDATLDLDERPAWQRWLGVTPGTEGRAARLLLLVFVLSAGLSLVKAAQSGVFLGAFDRAMIPWAFAASAVLLASLSALSVAWTARLGPVRMAMVTLAGSGLASAALWTALTAGIPWAAFATYVVLEASAGLLIISVWGVVSEAVDPRSAKRLYPLAGLGGSLAWFVGGFAIPALVSLLGAAGLLMLVPLVWLLCVGIIALIVQRDLGGELPPGRRKVPLLDAWRSGLAFVRGSELMRIGAGLAVLALLLDQLMDYQLMAAARLIYGDGDGIAGFFGMYYGVTSGISAVALLGLSGHLFSRLGASRALLAPQAVVLALAVAATIVPGFAMIVLLRGGWRVLKQALWSSAMQQVLLPLPSVPRSQARALTRGVLAPGGYAVAAIALTLLPADLDLRWLGAGTVLLSACTAALVATRVRSAYLSALQEAIDSSRLELGTEARGFGPVLDIDAVGALGDACTHADPQRAGLAAELLANASAEGAAPGLLRALEHPHPDVRVTAIESLTSLGVSDATPALGHRLTADPDVEVRRAAAMALRQLQASADGLEDALAAGESDDDAAVRAWCKVTRMEGRTSSERREALLPMLEAEDPAQRHAAAIAVTWKMARDGTMQSALGILLQDPDVETRKAAVRSTSKTQLQPLLPAVLELLDDPDVAPTVAESLDLWGEVGREALRDWSTSASPAAAWHVVQALAPHPECATLVRDLIVHRDPAVRSRALRAVVAVVSDGQAPPLDATLAGTLVERELVMGCRYTSWLAGVARNDGEADWEVSPSFAFLAGELERRVVGSRRRILCALVASGHPELLPALEWSDRQPTRLADARVAELLEVSLSRALVERLLPLFEPAPLERTISALRRHDLLDRSAVDDPIGTLADCGDEHLRLCAALSWGEAYTARYPLHLEADAPMLPLFERMRFLRSVPLFGELSGGDLRSVARIVDEVRASPGDVVLRKGESGENLFVIAEGIVEIRDGDRVLATLAPTEFFGELSVLDRAPRSADAVCIDSVRLLRLRGADLSALMAKRPLIQREIMTVLVRRLRRANAR